MPVSPPDLVECLKIARKAARAAWDVIAPLREQPLQIFEKAGEGPATNADIAADAVILRTLRQAFSDRQFGYLTEEAEKGEERLALDYCWIIDPIDGTRDFIEGRPDWAVQIGLAGRLEPGGLYHALLGVVYEPLHHVLYAGIRGQGAFAENPEGTTRQVISVSDQSVESAMNMVVTRSGIGPRLQAAIDRLAPKEVYERGSLGVKVCDVATGRADVYLNTSRRRCKEWDVCAPQAILEAAGGKLTDMEGNPVTFNRGNYFIDEGVLATNGRLHDTIAQSLREVPILWRQV